MGSYVCDSVLLLELIIGKVYRDTLYDTICSNKPYTWYGVDGNGNRFSRMSIDTPTNTVYKDSYITNLGFDSIFYLNLTGEAVTRYANMFASFYGYLSPEQQTAIKQSVLLNDQILKITTPYMRFYELEALCVMGEQEEVMRQMKAYWGGMLREGATTFWEKYNPEEQGTEHLQMYGRPYGKSLCHAWGASPIYLLGRYYLGVKPTSPGYATWEMRPTLGGLEWMEGVVPTPNGEIYLKMDKEQLTVRATEGEGLLYQPNVEAPMRIEAGREVTVNL